MQYFLYILTNVILPIFLIIAAGYILQKKFKLNIYTLSKLQFYLFMPSLLFIKIYYNTVNSKIVLSIIGVLILIFISNYLFTFLFSKLFKYDKKTCSTLLNTTVLFNSGNFCIPLIELLYKANPIASSVQAVILIFQSIMTNTVGVVNANLGKKNILKSILTIFKLPIIYAIGLAAFFRLIQAPVWTPVLDGLSIVANGIVPLALITLGAQLSQIKISIKIPKVYLASFIRLILSPFMAFIFVKLIGLEGVIAQVIVICYGAPSAINALLLAIEYDSDAELSSQVVFMTTLLSSVTVSFVIYLTMYFL
jgi:malate permease and related proteins